MKIRKALAGLLSAAMLLQGVSPATALAAEEGAATASDTVVLADFNFDAMADVSGDLEEAKNALSLCTVTGESLTLPSAGKKNTTITWTSSDTALMANDGTLVSRPEAGAGNAKVTLTAEISKNGESVTKSFDVEILEAYYGYIYGYITGDNDRTGSLHLAYSRDGKTYTALNSNAGVHFARINPEDGTKNLSTGIRFTEISLFRKADGTFGMAAPQAKDQKQVYLYDSKDLLTYTGERLLAAGGAVGNVSDVVVKYDAATDGYLLYWTSGSDQYVNATADLTALETAAEGTYTVPEMTAETLPENAKKGSVIGVTKAEYEKILSHFAGVTYSKTESLAPVTVEKAENVKDALPDTVSLTYDDGSSSAMQVKWDVDTPDFSKAGTYEVTGTVSSYENPLIEERADPRILYDEEKNCYYFTASYPAYGNVNNGYDRIILRKADTISGLSDDETEITIWTAPSNGTMAKHVWAPELHKIGGKWYVFFAAGNSDNIWAIRPYVLVCQGDDPYDAANWVNADGNVEIHAATSEDAGCFDAMSLDMTYFTNTDAEGTVRHYVIWAELSPSSLYMQEIDPKQPWTGKGQVICLTVPEYGWERDSELVNEGPAILKHDGKIFCTFSASGTGPEYCIGLLYADETSDLMDPASWTKLSYPILTSQDVPGEYGPGHNSFTVDTDGNPVFVYHARSEECYQNQCAYATSDPLYDPCRHARVKNVHWSRDGLPILNTSAAAELPEAAKTVTIKVTVNQDSEVTRDLADAVISGVEDAVETGEQICPEIRVTWGTASLTEGTDYTVAYGENKKGKGTVTITAKAGSRYTGTKTVEFKILPSLIADLSFDNLTDGLKGGNAAAAVGGGSLELMEHGDGKAAKFVKSEGDWLNVKAADGSALLDGYDEITVSYDILPSESGTNWVFYAAEDTSMLNWKNNGNRERYLGVLVKNGTTEIERYKNSGSRPTNPMISMDSSKWQHVDIVFAKDCTVAYLDGRRMAKETTAYALTDILGTGGIFQIGKANWDPGEYADMQLDNFRIVAGAKLYEEDKIAQAVTEIEEKLGDRAHVTEDLELLTTSSDGVEIVWSTSDPAVITTEGKVTVPEQEDATVTLTAVIGGQTEKIYAITVLAKGNAVNKLAAQLTLPYSTEEGREVYGNITLPEKIGDGTVTWTTDHPEIVNVNKKENEDYDATPAGVVIRPETDTDVTVTATVTLDGTSAEKEFTFTVKAAPEALTEDDLTDYFFAYFTGEGYADGEQIYFSASHDGLNWKELNDNQPVLTSSMGEKGVRDPFILRSPEGDKFYLIATDLKINGGNGWTAAQEAGSQALMVWESTDLVNWSKQRMVTVSAQIEAGCTWAPEATYDEKTGEYVVYWASKVKSDGYAKQRLYYAKTRDFYSFTEPEVYIDKDQSSIDTTMIEHNGTYYRYTKNEGGGTNELGALTKTIFIEKSTDVLGQFTQIPSEALNSSANQYVEGPTIFKLNRDDADTDTWCLLVDDFGGGGYYPLLTTNLESGTFTRLTNGYQLPGGTRFPRHGTPLRITAEEFAAVAEAYNMDTLSAQDLIREIDSLEITTANGAAVRELLDTWNTLTEEEKTLVTEERYVKLCEAAKLSQILTKDGVVLKDQSKNQFDFDLKEQTHAVYVDSEADGRYLKGYGSLTDAKAKETFNELIGGTQPFTVEMVINPNGYGEGGSDYNLLFSKGDDCAALRVSEKKLYFHIKDSENWKTATVDLTDQQMSSWIHVAAIYDGKNITAYADGKTATKAVGAILNSEYAFGIGYCEQTSRYGQAGIRSLHVYNTALNSDQLDQRKMTPSDDNVVLWYDIDTYSYGVAPTEIHLNTEALTLQVDETAKLEASFVPYYADRNVRYESLDEKVAAVSEDGTVTGVGDGSTVIRVSAENHPDVSVEIPVTVGNPDRADEKELQKLDDTIAEIEGMVAKEEAYTAESYRTYFQALEHAKELLKKELVTSAEVQTAMKSLKQAFAGLEEKEPEEQPKPQIDKKELQEAVNSGKAKDLGGYTAESADAYRRALAAAEKVLADERADQAEINSAVKALKEAEAGLKANAVQPPVDEKKVPEKGSRYDLGALQYQVTKSAAAGGTVTVAKLLKKNQKKVVIPAAVELDGYSFKVTAVSAKVFQKSKLKSVVIGANVTKIGKRSFFGCKKLKSITFKGKKAPKIGKQAFKGIQTKCRIAVPKKMAKKQLLNLKKRMKKAGVGSRAVYKK